MSPRRHNLEPGPVYQRLRRWFARKGRKFPWRGETDPYRVWISEIILVQTTTAVGVARYQRFLARFPTLLDLARASADDVMKEWEGLGYYHRARNLHKAARIIAGENSCQFPRTLEEIRMLPGIGGYVAAAIHNFCFDGRTPPLDANVARVGARLFGVRGDIRAAKVRRSVGSRLAELMSVGRGAVWTDALIDLGATVCLPLAPKCLDCPLSACCAAFRESTQAQTGIGAPRARQKVVEVACGIIRRRDGRILIAQRPETGLLPGLWEFPGGKRDGRESLAQTCRREIREELAVDVEVGKRRMLIRHSYSHYKVRLHVFECGFRLGRPRAIGCQKFRWVAVPELPGHAFPTANRQIIADLENELTQRKRSAASSTRVRSAVQRGR